MTHKELLVSIQRKFHKANLIKPFLVEFRGDKTQGQYSVFIYVYKDVYFHYYCYEKVFSFLHSFLSPNSIPVFLFENNIKEGDIAEMVLSLEKDFHTYYSNEKINKKFIGFKYLITKDSITRVNAKDVEKTRMNINKGLM